jgi:hypothetical protein
MAETARVNLFDATLGARGEKSWLDSKVMRRELTEDLQRNGMAQRQERAGQVADIFRDTLSKRAEMRSGLEQRSKESRRLHEEMLKRKAEEYREKLRSKLRAEVWE